MPDTAEPPDGNPMPRRLGETESAERVGNRAGSVAINDSGGIPEQLSKPVNHK